MVSLNYTFSILYYYSKRIKILYYTRYIAAHKSPFFLVRLDSVTKLLQNG